MKLQVGDKVRIERGRVVGTVFGCLFYVGHPYYLVIDDEGQEKEWAEGILELCV